MSNIRIPDQWMYEQGVLYLLCEILTNQHIQRETDMQSWIADRFDKISGQIATSGGSNQQVLDGIAKLNALITNYEEESEKREKRHFEKLNDVLATIVQVLTPPDSTDPAVAFTATITTP